MLFRSCLTTDIICGFPGEDDAAFDDTLDVVQRVGFDSAFVFKYSERRNTIAQRKFRDDVRGQVKTARVVKVNEVQKTISLRRNRALIGRRIEVLIEGRSRKSADDWMGRDDGGRCVVLPRGDLAAGQLACVEVVAASANTLMGRCVSPEPAPA